MCVTLALQIIYEQAIVTMIDVGTLIIGAGPTGLGAAVRFEEFGEHNWLLVEGAPGAGGLSQTLEKNGFKADIGGHVLHSHYKWFDDVLDRFYGKNKEDSWNHHRRQAFVVMAKDCFIPYPFQNNVGLLPHELRDKAVRGLLDNPYEAINPQNFDELLLKQNGPGICDIFLRPYNTKVWAISPKLMNHDWVKDRVSAPDKVKVVLNALHGCSDTGWGPNATFRYPASGGSGAIYQSIADALPQAKMAYNTSVESIDVDNKIAVVRTGDGTRNIRYAQMISTMPLDKLLPMIGRSVPPEIRYSSTHVVLIGVCGECPIQAASWLYFPSTEVPFYRATIFSRYANDLAPEGCYSLLLEVSESDSKQVCVSTIVQECVTACDALGFISGTVVEAFHERFERGYPTPMKNLHRVVMPLLRKLRDIGIYSRGRFGCYLYEASNQDHCVLQGAEAASHIMHGSMETSLELPSWANGCYNDAKFRGMQKE